MTTDARPARRSPGRGDGGRGRKERGGRAAGETRMQRFASRVERALESNDSLPARQADRRLVADLAELEVRTRLLSRALKALVSSPRSLAGERSFEIRLISLVYEVTGMHDLTRGLRGPLMRLVKERCAVEARGFELLTMAGSTIRGFAPPRKASLPGKARGPAARRGRRKGTDG